MIKEKLDDVLNESIEHQKNKLLATGSQIISYLTADDVLQPNDFPQLEGDPHFRYEEGYLHGLQAAYALFLSWEKSPEDKSYLE